MGAPCLTLAVTVAFLVSLSGYTNADYCSGRYCSDCCCGSYDDEYCCSCSLAWWAWFLIILAIILVIAVAVGIGVWRRRVFLANATVVHTVVAPPTMVHQQAYPEAYPTKAYPVDVPPPMYTEY
jgi:hypothetical protein